MSTIKETAGKTKAAARDAVYDANDELARAANKAGRQIRELMDTGSEEAQELRDSLSNYVRAKPVESSLIALGIGVVLGALLRR